MFFFFITLFSLLGRRLIGDWSDTILKSQRGPHEVADQLPISRQPVPDQSPTSRRPTAKPSCDSYATSAIVMNFGRGEVAERLQCMSDWGCPNFSRRDRQGIWSRPLQSVEIVGCSKISASCMCDYGTTKSKFTHQLLTLMNILSRIKI